MISYATSGMWGGWPQLALAETRVILYATASLAGNDLRSTRAVKSYASMGFLEGGVELGSVQGYPHILISFAYDDDASFFTDKLGYAPVNRLGDSGAFTAWTTGQQVDIDRLIAWCQRNVELDPRFTCISLDVIPGQPGGDRLPSKRERERAFEQSLANGDRMRAAGLKIMEVFHVGEPMPHLDLLLDRRQKGEVIGLGGMVGRSTSLKQQFCDAVFHRLRERSGWQELIPAHGLGLSVRSNLASRYPWWSIDSSSWIGPAMYGKHVTSAGKVGANDSRTSNRSVRHLYLVRTLEGWLKREREITALWEQRGVGFCA